MDSVIKVKLLSPKAKIPRKAYPGDLGYDLVSIENHTMWCGETRLISTGIAIELPPGVGAFIKDRSSVATKSNLFTVAGVIDNGYRGEIKVAIHNASDGYYSIHPGDRIAQLVLVPILDIPMQEIFEDFSETTDRSDQGFGSSRHLDR